jgi:hypothetical protein
MSKKIDYFCYGTETGEGVIAALKDKGARNLENHNGKDSTTSPVIYYTEYFGESGMSIKRLGEVENPQLFGIITKYYTRLEPVSIPYYRVSRGDKYYFLSGPFTNISIVEDIDLRTENDDFRGSTGNYFYSREEGLKAKEAIGKIFAQQLTKLKEYGREKEEK